MKTAKGWRWVAAMITAAGVGLVLAAAAPDTIQLDKAKDKMAPVVFPHKAHAVDLKIDCKLCHHKDADPAKAVVSCFNCHKAAAEGKTPDAKTAFHNRCQGCHKEKQQTNPKAPVKCMDCHKKS